MLLTLDCLRRFAVDRTFFAPTTLSKAIETLGFVQADPIRSPARAQDLVLRHRVKNYCAGDIENQYSKLAIEEDFFVNYGFMPSEVQALMHPRAQKKSHTPQRHDQMQQVLAYVRQQGIVHPKQVDAHFAWGNVNNWFGGMSKASTRLLDEMHHAGMLRVAGRVNGVRTYEVSQIAVCELSHELTHEPSPEQAFDALVDVIVQLYAPLSLRSLQELVAYLLRGGASQWTLLKREALSRAQSRLANAQIDGVQYYWPATETPTVMPSEPNDRVRLLAPFDPLVWDRRRFEHLWGWAYRFEAYTPAAKRLRGYYAMPMLWREHIIGWANVSIKADQMTVDLGYVNQDPPREAGFKVALDRELADMQRFLGV